MRRSVCVLYMSLGVCLVGSLFVHTDLICAQQAPVQNYVVQYGDTLWDIAASYLNNPYRWREIHQNNPQIVNPNLIYPGDVLGLYAERGQASEGAMPARAGTRLSDKAIARPWYGVPAPQPEEIQTAKVPDLIVPSRDMIESNGYIVPYTIKQLQSEQFAQITGAKLGETQASFQIIHSEDDAPGLVYGDTIYINRGLDNQLKHGDVFLAFRPVREITHPVTSEVLGTQIEILGRLRVKALEASVSAAEIVKSYYYMELGNPVMPVSEISIPLAKSFTGNANTYGLPVGNQLIGHIVAGRDGRVGISYGDIVFLDVGAAQGVQPADHFIIYREIGEGFPKQAIGRVTVLSAREQTSTAMVLESVKPINIGEKAVLVR